MSTMVNLNVQVPSHRTMSMHTPAQCLSWRETPEWKRVQPFSGKLVPEPKRCVEVSPAVLALTADVPHTYSSLLELGIRQPGFPPLASAQLTQHPTLETPPTDGHPFGLSLTRSHGHRPDPMGLVPKAFFSKFLSK